MSRQKTWVVELIRQIGVDQATAELVVDRLMEEGLLHLGSGDPDVDIIVAAFTDTFGVTSTRRTDRFAARRLAQKYGSQAVVGIIRLLGDKRDEAYCPVVNNLSEFERKFVSIMTFLRKSHNNGVINI